MNRIASVLMGCCLTATAVWSVAAFGRPPQPELSRPGSTINSESSKDLDSINQFQLRSNQRYVQEARNDGGEGDASYKSATDGIRFSYAGSTLWTDLLGVAVKDHYAFCNMGFGLKVLDISNQNSPRDISELYLGSGYQGEIALSGNFAFLTRYQAGLAIVDISDPAHPSSVRTLSIPGGTYDLTLRDTLAFLGGDSGLVIVNISDPHDPSIIGQYPTSNGIWDIYLNGDYAYFAELTLGMNIVDVSDPTNPQAAGTYSAVGFIWDVTVEGDYAFLTSRDYSQGQLIAHLFALDISDRTNPVLRADVLQYWQFDDMVTAGRFLYATTENGTRLNVFLLNSDLTWNLGSTYGLQLGNNAFTEGNESYWLAANGFTVVDVSDPFAPVVAGGYSTEGSVGEPLIVGNRVLVSSQLGLRIFDIGTPMKLTQVGKLDGVFGRMAVKGSLLCLASYTRGLCLVDITDTDHPQIIQRYLDFNQPYPPGYAAIALRDNYAYVVGDRGLVIFDLSDAHNPRPVGSISQAELTYCNSITLSGHYALVGVESNMGLVIVDIANPQTPIIASSLPIPSANSVAIEGNTAYVASWGSGLMIADITDPVVPKILGQYDPSNSGAFSIELYQHHVILSDFSGISMLDVSDPQNVAVLTQFPVPDNLWSWQTCLEGNLLSIGGKAGLLLINISVATKIGDPPYVATPSAFTAEQNTPNPFNLATHISYALSRSGNVRILIFNVLGQKVKTLVDAKQSAGNHSIDWDGKDSSGKTVSSGVYFYSISNDDAVVTRKMVLTK